MTTEEYLARPMEDWDFAELWDRLGETLKDRDEARGLIQRLVTLSRCYYQIERWCYWEEAKDALRRWGLR